MSKARHDSGGRADDEPAVATEEIAGNLGSRAGVKGTPRKHGGRVEEDKEEGEKKSKRHEKKASGGKVEEKKMHGKEAKHRMDRAPRRASGGRVGSDCSPISSAGRGEGKEMLKHGGEVKKKH